MDNYNHTEFLIKLRLMSAEELLSNICQAFSGEPDCYDFMPVTVADNAHLALQEFITTAKQHETDRLLGGI